VARVAIYPGSFDPLTNGHLDIIARSAKLFDEVIVAILLNIQKQPMFSIPDRIEMIQYDTGVFPKVSVDPFEGLLVHYGFKQ
jgi:pantetheine-phosphate adenylyltransferase